MDGFVLLGHRSSSAVMLSRNCSLASAADGLFLLSVRGLIWMSSSGGSHGGGGRGSGRGSVYSMVSVTLRSQFRWVKIRVSLMAAVAVEWVVWLAV